MRKRCNYFVAFQGIKNMMECEGSAIIEYNKPILTKRDIQIFKQNIQKSKDLSECVILSYKLM